jgi:high-affinity nickel-transport protein
MVDAGGFGFGLLVSGFWFGFRHGIDWDHIAAIADITSTQEERRGSIVLGSLYALGHAAVVLVLGILAIVAGDLLPAGIDEVMGRVVGVTLIVLAVYVGVSLIRHGRDFRLRSRWMLVFAGARRAARWVRRRSAAEEAPAVEDAAVDPAAWHHGHHGRPGHHHHQAPEREEPMTYGVGTALAVGAIHGVGAETPTQVLIFLAAAGTGGTAVGVAVLLAFIVGLLVSNSLITFGSAFGFLSASRNFTIYATVAVVVAVFSLLLGLLFVLGQESLLPAFFSS